MSSLAAMVFWLSPTARISATARSILGPLAGRWTRRGFFGGCNGVGTEFSGVSFIGYAPLCLGYSVINVHSSATPFSPYSRESIFCCGAGARAARSRGEGDRGRHSVPGISTARPLLRGTGLGGGGISLLASSHGV